MRRAEPLWCECPGETAPKFCRGTRLSGESIAYRRAWGTGGRGGRNMEWLGLAVVIFYFGLFVLSVIEAYRG